MNKDHSNALLDNFVHCLTSETKKHLFNMLKPVVVHGKMSQNGKKRRRIMSSKDIIPKLVSIIHFHGRRDDLR